MTSSRWLLLVLVLASKFSIAQEHPDDTVKILDEVVIQAFALEKPLSEVAASVAYIGTDDLNRFSETAILPSVNTVPGVRMEERSPGSYRFSIRGSLLRSPFGVRNVKVYWNGLPFTDAGGNTYLNLLDVGSIGSIEVIKGPGGSLYGAGTGGVLLLQTTPVKRNRIDLSSVVGSYGLHRYQAAGHLHHDKYNLLVHYAHQDSDGYRDHTEMTRDVINAEYNIMLARDKGFASIKFFYTRLFYQTPGGLTKTQYDTLPTQARPAGGPNRGAVQQNAHVLNKTPFLGISYEHLWNSKWNSKLTGAATRSDFENPAIRNVELREEVNGALRLENNFDFGRHGRDKKITFGGEAQLGKSLISVFDNNFGSKGSVQTRDTLIARLLFGFAQLDYEFANNLFVTAGASLNKLDYDYKHAEPTPAVNQKRKFSTILSPRIAVLKKVNDKLSIYGSVSQGYSPPSLAEVRPSTNNFNPSLKSENGVNYEVGSRGNINGISFDINVYVFSLDETIVIQRTSDGADYFINAGKTSQQGVEAMLTWNPIENQNAFVSDFTIWNSYNYNHYRFKDYVQDGNNYSNNHLTGIPPTVNTTGVDLKFKKMFYANITANYVDHTPLNDANTTFANEYFLVGSRVGLKKEFQNNDVLDVFAGVDNLLDKKYSLGNDLNAIGGRYYNAAPGINFYAGLKFTFQ